MRVCVGYPTGFPFGEQHTLHMNWGRIDPQPNVYIPSVVNPSGGMSLAPPVVISPLRSVILAISDTRIRCSGYILSKPSGQTGPLLSLIPEFTGFAHLICQKNVHIFRATPVFPYPCPSQIHHPIRYTRTQSMVTGTKL